jgi:6-phosphogluconolactonase
MLGIGPEGHVASLFPGMPGLYDERPVVAVRGSPKPPPIRLTLTLPSIQAAREVILLAQHNQFGKVALVSFAPLTAVHKVVTGRELPPEMISAIARLGIETILA